MKRGLAILTIGAILLTSYTTAQGQVSAAASSTSATLQGKIVNSVNLRSEPSTSGKIIGVLKKDTSVTIMERSNNYFYKVKTSNGTTGYVSSAEKYISVGGSVSQESTGQQATATVIYGVNLRDQPSTAGKVLELLRKGTTVTILEKSNNYFYKVKTSAGTTGYVSTSDKYLKVSGTVSGPGNTPQAPESSSSKIDLVIKTGKKYLGTPYEYGSDRNTTTTFDCSDFVRHAYREALGIVLPADSRQQGTWIRNNGTAVYNIDSLKAGDLVFFMSYKGSSASAYEGIDPNTERITHVAMYLGNGEILHTYSVNSGGVRIDKLSGSWERRFLYGGSVLK